MKIRGVGMINKLLRRTPQGFLLIINLLALVLLVLQNPEMERKTLTYFGIFIVGLYLSNLILKKLSTGDNYILLMAQLLISLGVIMIYRINPDQGVKQIVFSGIGMVAFFATYYILKLVKNWQRFTWLYLVGSMLLFALTLVFGSRIGGAKNWIELGPINFQPSEIIKILYVFFIASFYINRDRFKISLMNFRNGKLEEVKERLEIKLEKKPNFMKKLVLERFEDKAVTIIFMVICYSFIVLLFLQRELGIALLFFLVFNSIVYVYEPNRKFILFNIIGALLMMVIGYYLFSHVKVRMDIWLDPWEDINGKGYQIVQSLFAIAAGGFFGTGLGRGNPDFVPEVHTDFIFVAIAEEMGIFVAMAIILLFMTIIYRGIKISLNQKDRYMKIVSLGVTATIGFQTFIILGGVINMIPLTGITLPFVSYGGSSLVSNFISLAILQFASEDIESDVKEVDSNGAE